MAGPPVTPHSETILDALGPAALPTDRLAELLGWTPQELHNRIRPLEVAGVVRRRAQAQGRTVIWWRTAAPR